MVKLFLGMSGGWQKEYGKLLNSGLMETLGRGKGSHRYGETHM